MNNPFTIENTVLEILKESEEARNDDSSSTTIVTFYISKEHIIPSN